jgi:hypothetical protein
MNAKQRFLNTLSYQSVDRVPYLEEGIREEVLEEWYDQGLPRQTDLNVLFHYDPRDEIDPDLEPRPYLRRWPCQIKDLKGFTRRLNPQDHHRLPKEWDRMVKAWQRRDYPLILNVHQGFFLTLGVGDWKRFYEVIYLTKDQPALIQGMMDLQGEFAARLAELILAEVHVDAVLFSEPIGGNNGPVISPRMYREIVLNSYKPLIKVVRNFQVPFIIMRTYANPRPLLEDIFNLGINSLWACETPVNGMDFRELRRIYGRELRLIGGIDEDALRIGPEAIYGEIIKVPELLAQGGYIPLLDGRVRVDVPYKNYVHYRNLLEEITGKTG